MKIRCKRPLLWGCLFGVLCCVLWLQMQSGIPKGLSVEAGSTVVLQGRVDSVERTNQKQILYLSVFPEKGDSAEIFQEKNKTGVICYMKELCDVKVGQLVLLRGKIYETESQSNPGGFDSGRFYASKGYFYVLYEGDVMEQGEEYNIFGDVLCKLRSEISDSLMQHLDKEDYPVMLAMILGEKGKLQTEKKELYQAAGIYHILAISGMHITLLGSVFSAILMKGGMSGKKAAFITAILLSCYGIMVGMPVSAFRAICMFIVLSGSKIWIRGYDMLTAIGVAGFLLVIMNPYVIADSGFQLSFLAVLAIALLVPLFPGKNPRAGGRMDSLRVSAAVTIFTLPVLMCSYHSVSTYSFLANLLILPCMPYLFTAGLLIPVLHPVFPAGADLCGYFCKLVLFFYDKACAFLQALPFSMIVTGDRTALRLGIFYGGMLGFVIWGMRKKKQLYLQKLQGERLLIEEKGEAFRDSEKKRNKECVKYGLFFYAVLLTLLVILVWPERNENQITFLDVGQGDGCCILTDRGKAYLVDVGSSSEKNTGKYVLIPYLYSQGICKVEGWFLTHPDSDHVSAFMELEDEVTVEKLYIPRVLHEAFAEVRMHADALGIEVCEVNVGEVLLLDEWEMTVLAPEDAFYENENAASLVFALTIDGFTGIFMGDAGTQGEQAVLDAGYKNVTLLKVGHHGSSIDTNGEEFIRRLRPVVAVISCGKNNSYGHPHEETIQRLESAGSRIMMTPERGAITMEVGEHIRIWGEKEY